MFVYYEYEIYNAAYLYEDKLFDKIKSFFKSIGSFYFLFVVIDLLLYNFGITGSQTYFVIGVAF